MPKIIATLVVLCALTACSSNAVSDGVQTGTIAPPGAQPVASASVAGVMTMDQAKARYLALVAPGNTTLNKLVAESASNAPSFKAITGLCRDLAADDDTLARSVVADQWPAKDSIIDAFVDAIASRRPALNSCAAAGSLDTAKTVLSDLPDTSAAAQRVRIALGLPGTR